MNTTPKIIYHYFNQLTEKQKNQIEKLFKVYSYWNAQINVISRKDLDEKIKGLPIVTEVKKNVDLNCVMSNSFGFGGTNATLVFESI